MQGPQIVTHGDFDGVVSAALVGIWTRINFIFFTSPAAIRTVEIGPRDIICDLPHPARQLRAWFDHHAGNIEEAAQMEWSVGEGAAYEAPSAARVVFEHLKDKVPLPDYLAATVTAADRVDTMNYENIEAWLAEDPENIINATIFLGDEDMKQKRRFLQRLVNMTQNRPLAEVIEHGEIKDRYKRSQEQSARASEVIERVGRLIAADEICVLDFSEMKVAPNFSKNLAYKVFPKAYAVLSIMPTVAAGRKTNDLRLSFSLNPFLEQTLADHDCAAIFDKLELGGGHRTAAGGKITAESKPQRIKKRDDVLVEVERLWTAQAE